ncbi:MAG: HlyD family type I secretion periplasmic adaptor subunit [Burkholderiales bacterium]|nr:HlyD family type I secretion periplasmic adaptor subunit [Burkholderiales bacterium]
MNTAQSAPGHPVLDLLSRYKAVFVAAWDARHELAGPRRLADEAAFLPAALSLQATPVHPAPRRAAFAICALFVIVLAWASLGELDIVATAPGRIVVSDGTKLIQPLEAGVVKAIHVQDGDHVKAGQLLIELDATLAEADRSRVVQERASATSEFLRTGALLEALTRGGQPWLMTGSGLPVAEHLAVQAQLNSEWADISAKFAKLQAEAAKHRAESQTVEQRIDKLETTVPLARRREADFKALSDQGFMAGHANQDRMRERIELEKDLATERARKLEAQAAQRESEQAYAAQRAETIRTLRERHANALLKQQQLDAESIKATQKSRLTQLTASVDGVVQQLAVHTAGGVVTPAQALLVLVPDRAQVMAEVTLENKDIGFVNEGQHAEIKLETFPYTRYGTIAADVTRVAADAVISESAARQAQSTGSSVGTVGTGSGGASFPATLRLEQRDINVDGKRVHLSPGMNVTAEIKTGKRRVIDYLLSPVREHLNDSLKER